MLETLFCTTTKLLIPHVLTILTRVAVAQTTAKLFWRRISVLLYLLQIS